MLVSQVFLVALCSVATFSTEYFVSKNGSSHNECGNWTDPCGSLFGASIRIENNQLTQQNTLHVIDGQNETDILRYKNQTNDIHPCLPLPFNDTMEIHILFNNATINNLNDWFPHSICSGMYSNEYMFNGAKILTISNLIINHYATSTLGFIRSLYYDAAVTCINCKFINISSTNNNPLFHSMSSVVFVDNEFINIETMGNIIFADHHIDTDDAVRLFIINSTSFINVIAVQSFLNIARSSNDFNNGATLTINNCIFHNVSTQIEIIHDGAWLNQVTILDTTFNIIYGSVYYSNHAVVSHINIKNMAISTGQLSNVVTNNVLFSFSSSDVTSINTLDILYSVDSNLSCEYLKTADNAAINASAAVYSCQNPMSVLNNRGDLQIDYVSIDIIDTNIATSYMHNNSRFVQFQYEYANDAALMLNFNKMKISNISLQQSICYSLLYNEGNLKVFNLSFDSYDFDPNSLHSNSLIYQMGTESSLFVHNSLFSNSYTQIYADGGSVEIFSSIFQDGNVAIYVDHVSQFVLSDCGITNNGPYNGPFMPDDYAEFYDTKSIVIWNSQNIILRNNNFSGYAPDGLLLIDSSSDIILFGNVFRVTVSALFYNISLGDIYFESRSFGIVSIEFSSNSHVISNVFAPNEIYWAVVPWLQYYVGEGIHCTAGNTFGNYGIRTFDTNITSCLRQQLIHCMNAVDLAMCGNIDASLFDLFTTFMVDEDFPLIIHIYYSDVAMDNVNIITNRNATATPIIISLIYSRLLLVDSYIQSNDIGYDANACNVMHNNRLINDTRYILRLGIECFDVYNNTWYNMSLWDDSVALTMQSSTTELVNHLSVTRLNFTTKTTVYYPGALLQFDYSVMDRLDNIISPFDGMMTITLERGTFLGIVDIAHNECAVCVNGLLLNDVSMQNVGEVYTMNIWLQEQEAILEYDTFSVHISGCPVKYGADHNNFICRLCNTDYYNLLANNLGQCQSCLPLQNEGIQCIDGNIYISYNYWMGFNDDAIISALCPPNYCCAKESGCNYIDDNKDMLCAKNRDYNSVLCGKCNPRYSESLSSTNCVECNTRINVVYLLYPIMLAMLWSFYLVIISSNKVPNQNELKKNETDKKMKIYMIKIKRYLNNPRFVLLIKTLCTRNIMYYEQALSQILSSNSFVIVMSAFAQIFNLTITNNFGGDESAVCFIDGMNGQQKILIDLLIPTMIVIFVGVSHLISKTACKGSVVLFKKRVLNFPKCYISAFVLMIGNFLTVLFRLLHCQNVGSLSVHYYFGHENCYQKTWIISFIALILIICAFSTIFIKLTMMRYGKRSLSIATSDDIWRTFVDKYKGKYYYWEMVIFIRRIFIAMLSVSANNTTLRVIFVMIMIVFCGIQKEFEPFIVKEANQMEFWLLLFLILVIMMDTVQSGANQVFNGIIISFLIILPFIWMSYYIYKFVKHKDDDLPTVSLLRQRIKYLILSVILYYLPINNANVGVELCEDDRAETIELISVNKKII